MPELKAQTGELRATIHVLRKATGQVETYELVGAATAEQAAEIMGNVQRNRVHGSSGALIAQQAEMKG